MITYMNIKGVNLIKILFIAYWFVVKYGNVVEAELMV